MQVSKEFCNDIFGEHEINKIDLEEALEEKEAACNELEVACKETTLSY